MECKGIGCEREAKVKGMCMLHYKRNYKYGDENFKFEYTHRRDLNCSVESCNKNVYSKGYCSKHYHSNRKWGNPLLREKQQSEITKKARQNVIDSGGKRRFRRKGKSLHRLLLEVKLGRELKRSEHVHHIDNDPNNNELTNLYLFNSQREHNQCHTQLQKLSKELLEKGIIVFKDGKYHIK